MEIIPKSIAKGGTLKVRFIDKSEKQEGDTPKNYVLRIDQQVINVPPQTETQEGGYIYDYSVDTDTLPLAYGGHIIDICLEKRTRGNMPNSYAMQCSGSFTLENPLEGIKTATTRLADTADEGISLKSTTYERTPDLPLWVSILNSSERMSFDSYSQYMDLIFCGENENNEGLERKDRFQNGMRRLSNRRFLPFSDTDSYRVLKAATEAFVMVNCEVAFSPSSGDNTLFPENETMRLIQQRGFNVSGLNDQNPAFDTIWNNYLKPLGNDQRTLPYLFVVRNKLRDLPLKSMTIEDIINRVSGSSHNDNSELDLAQNVCVGLISERLTQSCFLELIWSYWHEESMMIQGLNAITRRFQNIRSQKQLDPLAGMEIDPLQPLNNLIWGYIQDDQHRLTVARRAYEYDHHYGFSIKGKAIQQFRPANSRTRFIESFHQLLYLCAQFYKQEDNTTIKADAFPIRNALREVHLILAEGAHNQYGDLPSTARIEMLMQQYLLARPEFRQFIPSHNMVANPEPWMDRVASLNKLMGWTDISPIHFHNLGVFGEQLLLSIRFGDWADNTVLANQAAVWANFWRQAIQEYIHAYHGVTGIDLAAERTNGQRIDSKPPSYHLARRLATQQKSNGSANGQGKYVNPGSNDKVKSRS